MKYRIKQGLRQYVNPESSTRTGQIHLAKSTSSSNDDILTRCRTACHRPQTSSAQSSTTQKQTTVDKLSDVLTVLAENQTHLHTLISKQHKTLDKIIKSSNDYKEQTLMIMEQQILALTTLTTQHLPVAKSKKPIPVIPMSHLEPSPSEGISLASGTNPKLATQDSKVTKLHSAQSHQHQEPDDTSIASLQSNQSQTIHGYHESKLTVDKFDKSWLQEGPKSKLWVCQIISELASKPYYHSLLTDDRTSIKPDAQHNGPNATLFSVLQNKLSINLRTMFLNC
jgi:hypothetical protein